MMKGRLVVSPGFPSVVTGQLESLSIEQKLKTSYLWGAMNSLFLAFVVYHLAFTCVIYGPFLHNIEILLALVLSFNTMFHISRIVWFSFKSMSISRVELISQPLKVEIQEEPDFTCFQRSMYDIVKGDKDSTMAPNLANSNFFTSTSTPLAISRTEPIRLMKDLEKYLKEYEEAEKASFVASSVESQSNVMNEYWSGSQQLTPLDVSPVFRRTVYQSSFSASDSGHSLNEDGGSPMFQMNTELWLKYRINPSIVVNWVSNLRMWISSTILQRIIDEISVVNNGLRSQGLSGLAVGHVGLDTLTNTAHNIMVSHNIPTLAFLIPFLEVSSNQQYVVQRIRDLAMGSSMSDYKWKSGGRFEEKDWEPHLPTDAELIMHLVSTYLDSQLPLLPSAPEARPFTTKYVMKGKDVPKQHDLVIHQQTINPPHYQLIVKNEVQEMPPGRNNLFYTLLLFIHLVQTNNDGMLERINLGQSGINMLWIVSQPRSNLR